MKEYSIIIKRYNKMFDEDVPFMIIGLYKNNLFDMISINQIAERIKRKYPFVYKKTQELISSGVLTMVQVGRSSLCRINLASATARYMLSYFLHQDRSQIFSKRGEIIEVKDALLSSAGPLCLVLPKASAKEIIMIVPNSTKKKGARPIKRVQNIGVKELGPQDFIEQLCASEHLYKSHRPIYNNDGYFDTIRAGRDALNARYNPLLEVIR